RLRDSVEMISKKNDLLNHLSISDELTGLLNRRGIFEAMLDKLLENPGKLVAVVFIDMDNLKQVNDTFGHNEGDFALKSIAKILKESFRQQDPIGRIGGDEFLAYMVIDEPNLVHRIRCNIETLTKELNTYCEKPYYVEMSVGVKEVIAHTSMDLKDILKEADNVLYEDKRNKRKSCFKNAM
ncbi:MAG: GGDEF domain-containing protein, partial [Lachnospiraceae bacterium]|nr:GGDEF domain-containing protein [Lachnospiraceae bacterium]